MRREKLSTTINIPEILDAKPFATPKSSKFLFYFLTLLTLLQITQQRSMPAIINFTE